MQTFTMKIHLYFLTFNRSKRNVLLIPLNTKVTNEIKKKNTLDNVLQFLYNAIIYIYKVRLSLPVCPLSKVQKFRS